MMKSWMIAAALVLAATLTAAGQNSVVSLHRDAEAALTEGRLQAAEQLGRSITEMDPAYAPGWAVLAQSLQQQEQYEEALQAMQTAADLDRDHAWYSITYARWLWIAGQAEDALRTMSTAVQQTDNPAAYRDLARWHRKLDRRQESVQAMQRALELEPNTVARRELGWWLWMDEGAEAALPHLQQALDQDVPDANRTVLQISARLVEENKPEQALTFYHKNTSQPDWFTAGRELVESGRTRAARPFLEKTWADSQEPVCGVYLAYVDATDGLCGRIETFLEPFVMSNVSSQPAGVIDMALESLLICGESPQLVEWIGILESHLGQSYESMLSDIILQAAERNAVFGRTCLAAKLFERVLTRDPSRNIWPKIYQNTLECSGAEAAREILESLLDLPLASGVKEGILGQVALLDNRHDDALTHFKQSLDIAPGQADIRRQLFTLSIQQGETDLAAEQEAWFETEVNEGHTELRSYLADIKVQLGKHDEALVLWETLQMTSPDVAYYSVEAAKAHLQACNPETALQILEDAVYYNRHPAVYEMLGEVYTALGEFHNAYQTAEEGLRYGDNKGLYRLAVENAALAGLIQTSQLHIATSVLYRTEQFMHLDQGYYPVIDVRLKTLSTLGRTNTALEEAGTLLEDNPQQAELLAFQRDLFSRMHKFRQAYRTAAALHDLLPDGLDAALRYAVSAAEYDRFGQALGSTRQALDRSEHGSTLALVYDNISSCELPGRNTLRQLRSHVEVLRRAQYRWIWPAELETPAPDNQVIMIFVNCNRQSLDEIDRMLQAVHGKAVAAVPASALLQRLPDQPSPEFLQQLQASGRWQLAGSGDEAIQRVRVATNTFSNPLTHPLLRRSGMESAEEYGQRIAGVLERAAAPFDQSASVFVYPYGDFGQRSMRSSEATMTAYREEVRRHFKQAFYYDSAGFILAGSDPLRLPSRKVPSTWSAQDLTEHLHYKRPRTALQLTLAKLLYWHRQHEKANQAFAAALEEGADPVETLFNWGANADLQGDVPAAHKRLTEALELAPDHPRIMRVLERLEEKKAWKVSAQARGWEDNEDRNFSQVRADARGYTGNRFQLQAFADVNDWHRNGFGSEQGLRAGLGLRAHLVGASWLDLEGWYLDMDELPDHAGGTARLHLPNPWLGGFAELSAHRENMETVEAMQADIYQDRYMFYNYLRLFDVWDLFCDVQLLERDDDNSTTFVNGRLVRRLKEWPYIGVGYRFRFGDSDEDPPEYWAPQKLEQHQLYGNIRGQAGVFGLSASGEAGYAREATTDWRFVWGGRLRTSLNLFRTASLIGEVNYFEGPVYRLHGAQAGLEVSF